MSALIEAGILGVGCYTPARIVTNADLEKTVDTTDEWIRTRTGISERRIAADGERTSDLAVHAARQALAAAKTAPEELDVIIAATVTPDYLWPATACLVQDRLGAKKSFAFDVSAACSGFLYGVTVAKSMVESGLVRRALVLGADKLSSIVDWKDRATCVLFGDGAGAAVIGPCQGRGRILSTHLGTDGSAAELLYIPAGGSRHPASIETLQAGQHFIKMGGKEVFKFAVNAMGEASEQAIAKAGLKPEDISLIIPHQANIRIIEAAAKRLNLSMDKVFVNIHKYGNTSAASIGIAMTEAAQTGRLQAGNKVVLVAFGAGLTWASAVVEW